MLNLLFALLAFASPRSDWQAWHDHEFDQFRKNSRSPFTVQGVAELHPGDATYVSLASKDAHWEKTPPPAPYAEFRFDGKKLAVKTPSMEKEDFLLSELNTPNGLEIKAGNASRGYVWVWLFDPSRNHFSDAVMPFFPFSEKFVVHARIDRSKANDHPAVKDTQGGERSYKVIGEANFKLGGKPQKLPLYVSGDPQELFITFHDLTNNESTYGGGRYVEAHLAKPGSNKVTIDFNRAYNPYCAYSHFYSCPLVVGNQLSVPVTAGAKVPPHE